MDKDVGTESEISPVKFQVYGKRNVTKLRRQNPHICTIIILKYPTAFRSIDRGNDPITNGSKIPRKTHKNEAEDLDLKSGSESVEGIYYL